MVLFLAEVNGLHSWGTNIVNAFLESFTKEKVYEIERPEFVLLKGHTLLINKALHGLRTS